MKASFSGWGWAIRAGSGGGRRVEQEPDAEGGGNLTPGENHYLKQQMEAALLSRQPVVRTNETTGREVVNISRRERQWGVGTIACQKSGAHCMAEHTLPLGAGP